VWNELESRHTRARSCFASEDGKAGIQKNFMKPMIPVEIYPALDAGRE
jgi:hypothetical protein